MELGEKLRLARLEAGLSQRQLCGDMITRNMLSLIENGSARPSMDTLKYLAARLNKPVSFLLEEDVVLLPNLPLMEKARSAYDRKDYALALTILADFQNPDAVFHQEKELLENLCLLALAEDALLEDRIPYAKELLHRCHPDTYLAGEIARKKQLLLARTDPDQAQLPQIDEELQLYAHHALAQGQLTRAAALLDAMEEKESSQWQLLRGQVHLHAGDYTAAAQCLHRAETDFPREAPKLLEICYRELGDFKQAYFYACKQR